MSDPAILFVRPGAIKPRDRKALQAAGVVVIEVDDPLNMKFVRASTELSGGALLVAAAKAISESGYNTSAKELFGKALVEAIKASFDVFGRPTAFRGDGMNGPGMSGGGA